MLRLWASIIAIGLAILPFPTSAQAELYFFKDKNGVLHITNVAPQSTLYLKKTGKAYRDNLRRFWPHIKKASYSSGIDPLLLAALVLVESGANPSAISQKGAIGLTQLMPETAKSLGVDPHDPLENLLGGALYLKSLIRKFDGDLLLALAAYNAGPGIVEQIQDIPPYRETQQYVHKVLLTWRDLLNQFARY